MKLLVVLMAGAAMPIPIKKAWCYQLNNSYTIAPSIQYDPKNYFMLKISMKTNS